jgi:cell volume regulation protein A
MGSPAIEHAQQILTAFSALFLAGAIAAKLADRLNVPDVVLFLLIGIVAGPAGLDVVKVPAASALNQLMLILGASFLLFQGGISVSFRVLKQVWITLILLATVAVLITAAVVGITAHHALGIELASALLLGAVIASTDPATLVPIFLAVRVRDKVAQTVLSESALNDATGAILTFAVLGVVQSGEFSVAASLRQFTMLAFGGAAIGAAFGLIAVFLKSNRARNFFTAYAKVLLLPVILGAYLTADYVGGSGFMAVFVVGLIYGNKDVLGLAMPEADHDSLNEFIDNGSLLLRMIIFILLGTHVDFAVAQQFLLPGLIVIAAFILIARPLSVLVCTLPDRRARWGRNEILFMCWTRETGAIPAALSGILVGMKVPHADAIAALTFLAILSTLLIQATTTRWAAMRLGLLESTKAGNV